MLQHGPPYFKKGFLNCGLREGFLSSNAPVFFFLNSAITAGLSRSIIPELCQCLFVSDLFITPPPSIFYPHFSFLSDSDYINRAPFELTLGPPSGLKIIASYLIIQTMRWSVESTLFTVHFWLIFRTQSWHTGGLLLENKLQKGLFLCYKLPPPVTPSRWKTEPP